MGKTGFAHLFEHFMFQGSRHVAKAEHLAIVQGAGGVCNATTYFDRTNYFETLPSHQVELGLWLEADRMATLLDALSQENLDNQRDVVKNEKRQSYDNRPYGSFYEKLMAAVFPAGHPYHHTPIGSMEDLDAASLDDVQSFFRAWYVPNNAVLTVAGDVDEQPVIEMVKRYFGPIEAEPAAAHVPPARPWPGGSGRAWSCPTTCPSSASTWATGSPAFGTRAFDALEVATQILAGGRGSRLHRRLVRDEQLAQDVTFFVLPLVAGLVDRGRLGHRAAGDRRGDGRGDLRRGARAHDAVSPSRTTSWRARTRSSNRPSWPPFRAWTRSPTGCRCTPRTSTDPS